MKITVNCIIALISALLLFPPLTFSQSAKEALIALKKLEARCEAGISYRDYSPALGEAKFPVNLFLESSEAKENPDLALSIKTTFNHYDIAKMIWEYEFPYYEDYYNYVFVNSEKGQLFLKLYPNLEIDRKYIYVEGRGSVKEGEQYIVISSAVRTIWAEASKELKKATSLHSKLESETIFIKAEVEKLRKENETLKGEIERLKRENEDLRNKVSSSRRKK
jgi:hypothetical protein